MTLVNEFVFVWLSEIIYMILFLMCRLFKLSFCLSKETIYLYIILFLFTHIPSHFDSN